MKLFDVIIVGGGPAGLNAAVVLGRCNRHVLLFDHGKQRNIMSHGMHNFLTRDDISPKQFLEYSHAEIKKYGVKMKRVEVTSAKKMATGNFQVTDIKGKQYHSKKMILATGVKDKIPDIPGTDKFYGTSIHHCPYCDGWEHNGEKIAVYAKTNSGIDLAETLLVWSDDITLFTDGEKYLTPQKRKKLERLKIKWREEKVTAFKGKGKIIKYVEMQDGGNVDCDALFFSTGYSVQCQLVESLGCTTDKNKIALTNKSQKTNIDGCYVAGDTDKDVQFVVVAAAEGAKAAVYINKELMEEDHQ